MKKSLVCLLAAVAVIVLFILYPSKPDMKIDRLEVEALVNPLAIDNIMPHFSWVLLSETNGTAQTAYQILVASEKDKLTESKADLWNTGKVNSDDSNNIIYEGKALSSKDYAYWCVRVWDERGRQSAWSEPAFFAVGLLDSNDWEARYISQSADMKSNGAPLFWKSFECKKEKNKYLLHVNSLGYHEAYLNGEAVSDAVLTPAVSQYDKHSLSVTYDVSSLIRNGRNDLVVWSGRGWYQDGLPGVVEGGPFIRAQLEKLSKGNSETVLATDESWKTCESGYESTGDWRSYRFGGDYMDANRLLPSFSSDALDNGKWVNVSTKDIAIPSVPQMAEMNRIRETFSPISMKQVGDSAWVYDFGTNLVGWTKVTFRNLEQEQKVRIGYCDFLDENGNFRDGLYEDIYVAAGKDGESFMNKFNYHGFRFMKLFGVKNAPELKDINAYLIHTDYQGGSSFESSDEDMNAIHDMVQRTLRCLTLGGDMVDCPQIERLGYGGDGNASTLTVQTMFNMVPTYMNWMLAWADCMREDGSMPHIAPNPYSAGGGPFWCGFIITASWQTYVNYGDKRLLERYYPYMKKWLEYVEKYKVDGLLKEWPATDYRNWYLGDWATPQGIDQTDSLSINVVNNCFVAYCYQTISKIAALLGNNDDKNFYLSKYHELIQLVHQVFFNPDAKSYSTGTQIDLIYPMLVGATPRDLLPEVEKTLFNNTETRYEGHLSTGLVGIPVITRWAVQNNQADYMFRMLKKRTYPGYLYMIDNGATTTWEHWNGRRSHIHNCYNGIGSWFYQALAGIIPDEEQPGYKHIIIRPQLVNDISWVKASKDTPFGRLEVDWHKSSDSLAVHVSVPVGSKATLDLPLEHKTITINGEAAAGDTLQTILSGNYIIKGKLK